jgi:hypothetical protein
LLIIEKNNKELKEVASPPPIRLMLHRDEPCGARLKA